MMISAVWVRRVNCRIGSLEMQRLIQAEDNPVNCRIGSLENEGHLDDFTELR